MPPFPAFMRRRRKACQLQSWERCRPGGEWMEKYFNAKHAGETPALPGSAHRSDLGNAVLFSGTDLSD
jgi:hypothetical protein